MQILIAPQSITVPFPAHVQLIKQHVDSASLSALPQDHPQRHQTFQPAAGRRRPRQDRRLWRQQRVRGDGRPLVLHGGDAGLHGARDDDRARAELQWEGEAGTVKEESTPVSFVTHLVKLRLIPSFQE